MDGSDKFKCSHVIAHPFEPTLIEYGLHLTTCNLGHLIFGLERWHQLQDEAGLGQLKSVRDDPLSHYFATSKWILFSIVD